MHKCLFVFIFISKDKMGEMFMTGVFINVLAIIIGCTLGLTFKRFIKDSYKETIMAGIAITIIMMGTMNVIETNEILIVIVSVVLGSLIGEILDIEGKINSFANGLSIRFSKEEGEDNTFVEGFVTTTLIFCVGAMAIVGSIESGLTGAHETLYAKSLLDGVSAVIFASTFGIGVIFSIIPVFLYEGGIVLGASLVKSFLTPAMITEISAVGGVLIIAIALNILDLKKIKIGNMLPAILIPVIYFAFMG